jgi:hypothetical protein
MGTSLSERWIKSCHKNNYDDKEGIFLFFNLVFKLSSLLCTYAPDNTKYVICVVTRVTRILKISFNFIRFIISIFIDYICHSCH